MLALRSCTVIILTLFLVYSGTIDYPGVPTAMASDMPDSDKESPNPRFTDNGNGTITDNLTGLIWLQNANVAGARMWADALTDVEDLNRDGAMNGALTGDKSNGGSHQKDWRLPDEKELASLTDYTNTLPSGYSNFFSDVQSDSYWSSETLKGNIAYA